MVKAQVHAGGRGKAGGVKVAKDLEAVRAAAKAMLGTTLVTHQTGPARIAGASGVCGSGIEDCARDLLEPGAQSRCFGRIAFVASAAGGMDIEEVAEHTPEKIIRVNVHPTAGLAGLSMPAAGLRLRVERRADRAVRASIAHALYRLYLERDASLVEVNPLIVTADGDLLALDAKINIEDNALFRHKDSGSTAR